MHAECRLWRCCARAKEPTRRLEATDRVTLVTIPDTGHFALNDKPARVAELMLDAVSTIAAD